MKCRIITHHLKGFAFLYILNGLTIGNLLSNGNAVRQQSCQPPDAPSGGKYVKVIDDITNKTKNSKKPTDESVKYLPGDEISYACEDGLLLTGNRKRSCTFSGEWTGYTPFCDQPINIKDVWVTNYNSREVKRIIDGNHNTCYKWDANKGDIQAPLSDKSLVKAIRIYLHNGTAALDVNITENEKCGTIRGSIGSSQWVLLECQDNRTLGQFIRFRNISPKPVIIYLCEIQVYVKDGCETPPNFYVTNGHLEVGRKRAILLCDAGYKAKSDRVVCENNKWKASNLECIENVCSGLIGNGRLSDGQWELIRPSLDRGDTAGTRRELRCNIGYKKKGTPEIVTCLQNGNWTWTNATCIVEEEKKNPRIILIASVAAVVSLILFFLMGLTIYLVHRQRARDVVVVYKSSTDGSTTAYSEIGYCGPQYEAIAGAPKLPSSPRPAFSQPSLSDGYLVPDDCRSLKGAKSDRMPADIAFGTLKSSTVYGT